mmetsp:Transcript_69433/g.148568  ORF Transcript_69433/g.148568 Transcript_69433/m.148568 type:complete len:256 (+) Transcript_69433:526-1293(+)
MVPDASRAFSIASSSKRARRVRLIAAPSTWRKARISSVSKEEKAMSPALFAGSPSMFCSSSTTTKFSPIFTPSRSEVSNHLVPTLGFSRSTRRLGWSLQSCVNQGRLSFGISLMPGSQKITASAWPTDAPNSATTVVARGSSRYRWICVFSSVSTRRGPCTCKISASLTARFSCCTSCVSSHSKKARSQCFLIGLRLAAPDLVQASSAKRAVWVMSGPARILGSMDCSVGKCRMTACERPGVRASFSALLKSVVT